MNLEAVCAQMEKHAQAIRALAENVPDEQARWKPSAEDWSILEVINHLYDEEIEDFREHLDLILHRTDEPWSSIDPQGWVTARGYNQRDPAQSLDQFLRARQASIAWLKGLSDPHWSIVYPMPWGQLTAGDMLASWLAHDLLHLRQLVELHWAYTTRQVEPFDVGYAGGW